MVTNGPTIRLVAMMGLLEGIVTWAVCVAVALWLIDHTGLPGLLVVGAGIVWWASVTFWERRP